MIWCDQILMKDKLIVIENKKQKELSKNKHHRLKKFLEPKLKYI